MARNRVLDAADTLAVALDRLATRAQPHTVAAYLTAPDHAEILPVIRDAVDAVADSAGKRVARVAVRGYPGPLHPKLLEPCTLHWPSPGAGGR